MSSAPKTVYGVFEASGDLSASQFCFVKLTDNKTVAIQTSANGKTIGILMNAPTAAGDLAEVAMIGGGGKLKLSGTVTWMDKLTGDTAGKGGADTGAGQWVGAQALENGVSGDVIAVIVTGFESQA